MKANRRVVLGDDAVSPVIAVILMVAITVVLAATVYLWVSGFGNNQGQLVNASFAAKAVDLPWGTPGTHSDTDDSDDAIEITYTSGSGDMSNLDIQIFVDGALLNWTETGNNFIQANSTSQFTAGGMCTSDPGGDSDDIWERGSSVFLIDTTSSAAETDCDGGTNSALADLGDLDGIHLLKVVVKGQVVLDTSIEVHDNAGA